MKKTIRTVLTAAAFAAAGVSAMTAVAEGREPVRMEFNNETERDVFKEFYGAYGPPPTSIPMWDEITTTEAIETITTTTTTMPRTVYGPTSTSTVTTAEQEDVVTLTTTMVPQPVYGPAPVYMGDANMDGVVDIFDSIAIRKAILFDDYSNNNINRYFADLNKDGEISVGDLVILNKYLLGKIKDLENYPAMKEDYEAVVTTTYDPVTDRIQTAYGPPWLFYSPTSETTANVSETQPGADKMISEEK